ncbi:MAG: hypothetical protein ACRD0I_09240 [Acidimicrobiales bacterium]
MRWLKAFGHFWWDFVIGDTPGLTLGVVVAIALGALFAHVGRLSVFLVPLAVLVALGLSLQWARRSADRARLHGGG